MAGQAYEERTNDQWVAALRGDSGSRAQEAAYKDLANYLYRVIFNYLSTRRTNVPRLRNRSDSHLADLAEEFTQSVIVDIALDQIYNQYRSEGRFLSFMAVVALNKVRQALRRKEWSVYEEPLPPAEPEYDPESGVDLPPLDPEFLDDFGPEVQQELQDVRQAIRHCSEQLPDSWREAFFLSVFQDLPANEIKERIGAPSEQEVYNRVHRARRRLKDCLTEQGWDLDDIWQLLD